MLNIHEDSEPKKAIGFKFQSHVQVKNQVYYSTSRGNCYNKSLLIQTNTLLNVF